MPLVEHEIFIGPAWIIVRCAYGEITWYLTEKELLTIDTVLASADAVRRHESRKGGAA